MTLKNLVIQSSYAFQDTHALSVCVKVGARFQLMTQFKLES